MDDITKTLVDNYQFLNTVFDKIGEDEEIAVCAFTEPPEDRETWPVYAPYDNIVNRFINPKGRPYDANSYFCISSVRQGERLTRGGDAIMALYLVPLEDVGTKLPVEKVPLPPSYAIETSRGNFHYGYLLDEPCRDIAKARAVLKLVTQDHGDPAAPIAGKLIRLPQGYNNKKKYPETWQVRCTIWEPSRRYSIEDLLAAFGIDSASVQVEAERLTRGKASKGAVKDDEVWDWLVHEGYVLSDVNAEGFATIICPWHATHTEAAANTANYSPLGCGGPSYQQARQFQCFHGHCASRHLEDFLKWYFRDRYVMGKNGMVYDLLDVSEMTFPNFQLVTKPLWHWGGPKGVTKIFYAVEWLLDRDRRTVTNKGFHPAKGRIYRDNDNLFVNTWKPIEHPKADGFDKALPIIAQIKYLFGADTEHMLGFMGWTVLHPEDRIQHALLHISTEHGTGRGWLKKLFQRLLVHSGYLQSTTLLEFMTSPFNQWLLGSLLVSFDEVREKSMRFKVQDRIRELITESRMAVNVKNGFKGTAEIHANIIMFSNHMAPLDVPPEDRRIWPVVCPHPPLTEAEYDVLYALLDDPEAVAQFYWFLKQHLDTKGFKPFSRAPKNTWTNVVFGADGDPLNADLTLLLSSLRERGVRAIFRQHLVDIARALHYDVPLPVYGGDAGRDWARVNAVLSDLGVVRSKRRARTPSGQTHMYIIDRDPRELIDNETLAKKECVRVLTDPQFDPKEFKL